MKSRRSFLGLIAVLALAVGGGALQARRLRSAQREELRAAQTRLDSAQAQILQLGREQAATARELEAAARQLAQLPLPPTSAERAREIEIRAWLARMNRLRQLFKDRPDQAIPELRLLTDVDWLRASRRVDLGDETHLRQAFATVRDTAQNAFTSRMAPAVSKYMRETKGEKPASVFALTPYFEILPDPDMLQRYEVIALDQPNRNGTPGWAIRSAAAVDADYDSRREVQSTGGGMVAPAPEAWIPNFRERSTQAYKDYMAANFGGSPIGFASIAPFFNPPLEPALVEKIIRAERDGHP